MKFSIRNRIGILELLQLLAVCFFAFIFSACNKESSPDCLQKAGEYETEKRSLNAFNRLAIFDYLQVELYDSTETFIEVTAPRNLIPEIITEVDNGQLRVANQNSCNWVRSYKNLITVRIYSPEFRLIQNNGTGNIKSINTLKESNLNIENHNAAGLISLNVEMDSLTLLSHTGVSDALFSGEVNTVKIFSQGLGWVDARYLHSQNAFVNNSSINNVYVSCSEYLFGLVLFSGNIYYSGHPDLIDADRQGEGQLIALD